MKYIYTLLFIVIATIISACSLIMGPKKVTPGGTLTLYELEKFQSIYPHSTIDAIGVKVVNQIFEGLVRFNEKDLSIEGALATNWKVSADKKIYTFYLKKGVLFHEDKCFTSQESRNLTADDVVFSFNRLCSYHDKNLTFLSTFSDAVVGANENYIMSVNDDYNDSVSGIKKIDDYTVEIELVHPNPYFLYVLASPAAAIFPVEAYQMYQENLMVGTGPFKIGEESNTEIILEKNYQYHRKDIDGIQLPYLDKVQFKFGKSVEEQVKGFNSGQAQVLLKMNKDKFLKKLHHHGLANKDDEIKEETVPYMGVSYCGFNLQDPHLAKKKVRQAINYAIDVVALRRRVFQDDSSEIENNLNGITPPVFTNYNPAGNNYELDIEKAQQLLKEAGYENGKELGTITIDINKGRGDNPKIAAEIKRQLKENLNIDISINVLTFHEKLNKSRNGESQFFKAGWIADYPHPQNFLSLFYGKDVPELGSQTHSYPNVTRFQNAKFDSLYEAAAHVELDQTFAILEEAERIMMEEAPGLILWYGTNQNLMHESVHGFPTNAMSHIDFSKTWIEQIQ